METVSSIERKISITRSLWVTDIRVDIPPPHKKKIRNICKSGKILNWRVPPGGEGLQWEGQVPLQDEDDGKSKRRGKLTVYKNL